MVQRSRTIVYQARLAMETHSARRRKLYTRLYTMIENGTSSFMFPLAESFAHDFGVEGNPSLRSSKSCMSSRLQMGVLVWFATEFISHGPYFSSAFVQCIRLCCAIS
jgi:hypothetical protein